MCLRVLSLAEVEPLGDASMDDAELLTLKVLSAPQLGHERRELLPPLLTELHDDVQVVGILQKDTFTLFSVLLRHHMVLFFCFCTGTDDVGKVKILNGNCGKIKNTVATFDER